jgi:hypothetical protein
MNTGRTVNEKVNWTKLSKPANVLKNYEFSRSRKDELTQIKSM